MLISQYPFQPFMDVLSGTHAFITEQLITSKMCNLPGVNMDELYVSPPIDRKHVSFSFPKNRSNLVEKVFDNFGWLIALGINQFNEIKYGTSKY